MKVIVDTNIVFSAILNIDSNIARVLLEPNSLFDFYSCDFLRQEINLHKNKILKITGYSEQDFLEIEHLVTKNITFINHLAASPKNLEKALNLCKVIDVKDYPFVALCLHYKGTLWSGDQTLLKGLKKKKFSAVITTTDLLKL